MKYRKPTPEEEVAAWRRLAFRINLHRTLTMDHREVIKSLENIDAFCAAHNDSNGQRSQAEVQKYVNEIFWTKIAQTEPPALAVRPKRKQTKTVNP